ncbi:M18 family aminopeptidase [Boudabousia liubingyangii]|uniref:M18 family aminopeptidase n=1 Tax=Boudabousia liubingyangii TaxID=1921764 RepID=UPI00093F380D|nr:M18 family aminopeptidase [Boudabousia liubingyangii]OKL46364.1 M18 family aminopeptidase [Boudabousia liubingyangii]
MDTKTREWAANFAQFIVDSPSCYHAAASVAKRLDAAGFRRQEESETWDATPGGHYIVRDGAVLAYWIPQGATPKTPFRVVGVHTDSPGLKLKPHPDATTPEGFKHLGVEVYGGPLFNSWLDRDLELAGRVTTRDGRVLLARTGAIMRVPQLAIHLDRTVNNEGLKLSAQKHLHPIWGINSEGDFLSFLAEKLGLSNASEIVGYDLITVDAQAPNFLGAQGELMAGGRMDNLVGTYAGLVAMEELVANGGPADGAICVLAAFDHEEVGSSTRAGAAGPILEDVLRRTHDALGGTEETFRAVISLSNCMSSDVGHSVHPNYSERHDPDNRPVLGGGPMLKVNAQQRYTTDALGESIWEKALVDAGLKGQVFVSNNDMPCGSTIGPITATRLGLLTFDVGIAILSMHSVRELCHVQDLLDLSAVMGTYWHGAAYNGKH